MPGPPGTGRTFDVKGAAEYLGCHPAAVGRWAKDGQLRGFRDRLHPGGPWRFIQGDLDQFRDIMQEPNRPAASALVATAE